MSKQEIVINVGLPVRIKKEKKWYAAICDPLDVAAQGESEKKALSNLKETLTLFLISCIERNTLDMVLADCGFKKALPLPPKHKAKVAPTMHRLDIPLNLLSSHSCRA